MLTNLNRLQATTCNWLVQVAVQPNAEQPLPSYAPMTIAPIVMPVTTIPPDTLRYVHRF